MVRRAALLTTGTVIDRDCIEFLIEGCPDAAHTLKESMKELEKKMIREALEKTGGNKAKAAEMLVSAIRAST